jgi:formate dehydrogenase subunit gamma
MSPSSPAMASVVDAALSAHRGKVGALLPVLHEIQERLGFVPADAVPQLAGALNLSRAEVQGVVDFYHDFRNAPAGRHVVKICRAEACQAMGAIALEAHLRERLGTTTGETSADGRYTLEPVYCLGNCACAPSVQVDGRLHARVDPASFDAIVERLEQEK